MDEPPKTDPGPARANPRVKPLAILLLVAGFAALALNSALPGLGSGPSSPPTSTRPTPAPPQDRWVSGDMHLHSETSRGLSLQSETFLQLLEEHDLDVGVVHIWGVRPHNTAIRFSGRKDHTSSPRILHYDLEVSSFRGLRDRPKASVGGYPDHVIGLNLKDWRFPRRLFTKPIVDWVHAQGAVAGIPHAGLWGETDQATPSRDSHAPIELPACLALGQELFLSTEDVRHKGFYRLYYGLLDCGFTVPLTAGSDYPVAPGAPGSPRTHVRLPAGTSFSYANWVKGIRLGRTSISANRHDWLALRSGSSHAGDRVAIASQARVPFAVSYRLPSEATNVELVANGEVVAQKDLAGSGVWRPDVTIADSAWVLARCTTAHTGPIYVDVAGRPIRASVASARQFVRHVDRLLGELDEPGFSFGTPSDEERALIEVERQRAKATYEESRGIWQRLEEECRERERLLAR